VTHAELQLFTKRRVPRGSISEYECHLVQQPCGIAGSVAAQRRRRRGARAVDAVHRLPRLPLRLPSVSHIDEQEPSAVLCDVIAAWATRCICSPKLWRQA